MLFYEFNLRSQQEMIYVFPKRGGEIFKKSRTPRPAASKSATTAAETKCRSLPSYHVFYFEVPASSEIRLINISFMLSYEFNLRPQQKMIYVFLRGEERLSKKLGTPRPAASKSAKITAETKCRSLPYYHVCYFEVPASSEIRLIDIRFMLFYEFTLRPQPERIYVFHKKGGEIFKNSRTPKPAAPKSDTTAAETKFRSLLC